VKLMKNDSKYYSHVLFHFTPRTFVLNYSVIPLYIYIYHITYYIHTNTHTHTHTHTHLKTSLKEIHKIVTDNGDNAPLLFSELFIIAF
jgi:hypothetical protein